MSDKPAGPDIKCVYGNCHARLSNIGAWVDEADSELEQAKHPEQFDMWITGYEQAMLDVKAMLEGTTES